ncbi:Glucooligosaccharide oxidase [Xylariomycetidae sp. FL0641]|nr:Glucooligosaccharide oxidase [Xylariomycetidae sp. FL0641]
MRTATFGLGLFTGLAHAAALNRRAVLEDCLQSAGATIDEVGSEAWNLDTEPFNARLKYTPTAVVVPTTEEEIVSALKCGQELGYKVTPKGGGHSYASYGLGGEDGHLIIQLDRMFEVKLDTETGIATVQPGSRLGHVAEELWTQGKRAISHGTCPGVGVAGHALHGGFGMASHTHGLAMDWIDGLRVALANGTVVHCSATENPDLFWGMLGAGSNFGVVTQFELKTFEPPANLTWFVANLPWKANDSVAGLEALEDYTLNTMPAELNMRIMGTARMTQLEGTYQGSKEDLEAALEPLFKKTNGRMLQAQETDWIGSLKHYATMSLDQTWPHNEQEMFYSKSLELKGLHGAGAKSFSDYWFNVAKDDTSSWFFQLDLQGGKHSAVWNADPKVSSYAHRDKLYILQFWLRGSKDIPEEGIKFINDWSKATTKPLKAEEWGIYINYPDIDLDRETALKLYYGNNLARLQQLKAQFDPDELFYYPVALSPVAAA